MDGKSRYGPYTYGQGTGYTPLMEALHRLGGGSGLPFSFIQQPPQAPRLDLSAPRPEPPLPLSAYGAQVITPPALPRLGSPPQAPSHPVPASSKSNTRWMSGISTCTDELFKEFGSRIFSARDAMTLFEEKRLTVSRSSSKKKLRKMLKESEIVKIRRGFYQLAPKNLAPSGTLPGPRPAALRPVFAEPTPTLDLAGPESVEAPPRPTSLDYKWDPSISPQSQVLSMNRFITGPTPNPGRQDSGTLTAQAPPKTVRNPLAPVPKRKAPEPEPEPQPAPKSDPFIPVGRRLSPGTPFRNKPLPSRTPSLAPILFGQPGTGSRETRVSAQSLPPAKERDVFEEVPFSMADTDFIRYSVDTKGDGGTMQRTPVETIRVSHPMVPDPAADNGLPFRKPGEPSLVHPLYASEDGRRCAPEVSIKEVLFNNGQLDSIKSICEREKIDCTPALQKQLKDSVRKEMMRLIKGQALQAPRLAVRKLKEDELPAHEKALAGQYGAFVDLRLSTGQQHTLRNGKILALYAGAVLEPSDITALDESGERDTRYAMALTIKRTMDARGFANSMAFVNTAFKPGSDPKDLDYDEGRNNCEFVCFRLKMTDKHGKERTEQVVALVGFDRLYDSEARPAGEARVSYGDNYRDLENPQLHHPVRVKDEAGGK